MKFKPSQYFHAVVALLVVLYILGVKVTYLFGDGPKPLQYALTAVDDRAKPRPVKKTCGCSSSCTCGCQQGGPCECDAAASRTVRRNCGCGGPGCECGDACYCSRGTRNCSGGCTCEEVRSEILPAFTPTYLPAVPYAPTQPAYVPYRPQPTSYQQPYYQPTYYQPQRAFVDSVGGGRRGGSC